MKSFDQDVKAQGRLLKINPKVIRLKLHDCPFLRVISNDAQKIGFSAAKLFVCRLKLCIDYIRLRFDALLTAYDGAHADAVSSAISAISYRHNHDSSTQRMTVAYFVLFQQIASSRSSRHHDHYFRAIKFLP